MKFQRLNKVGTSLTFFGSTGNMEQLIPNKLTLKLKRLTTFLRRLTSSPEESEFIQRLSVDTHLS